MRKLPALIARSHLTIKKRLALTLSLRPQQSPQRLAPVVCAHAVYWGPGIPPLATQRGPCQHPHFDEGQTEARSWEITCSRHTVRAWETRVWQTGCYGDPVPSLGALQRPLLRTPSLLQSLANFSHPPMPVGWNSQASSALPHSVVCAGRGWGSRTPENSRVKRQEWTQLYRRDQEVGQANPGPAPPGKGSGGRRPSP